MTLPWNGWFHCIGGTYGSWLPGDPRGFRTRHHREHVEGDYKNPPPAGIYEDRHRRANRKMRFAPVVFSEKDRILICQAMASKLLQYDTELVELAIGGQHFHALCRFPQQLPPQPDGTPRPTPRNLLEDGRNPIPGHIMGRAKRAASIAMGRAGHKLPGLPLWAARTKFEPIRNRRHQVAVVRYIRRHADDGALVWSLLSEMDGKKGGHA